MNTVRSLLAAAVAATVCSTTLVAATASAETPAERSAETPAPAPGRVIKPGQVGQAVAGMTVAEALATGEFDADVPAPPCDPIRLRPKGVWRHQYAVLVNQQDRIAEIAVFGTRPRTVQGLGVGSTNREVKQAYGPRLSAPIEVGFGQWGRFVRRGTGAERRWIGFLFGEAFVADRPLRGRDEVTLVGVRTRFKPGLVLDGC
ncbi:hypothetical protein FE634_12310 [Nocardioides dongxiaopingii]|uniref:hypothetical protein n=1 Tax=Nocardioides sp. S-1144 TaxID=2582905 RepID=UPI0011653249|nr:hypothetical protein [Nocardioides sp. S-1144]QCW50982.2 hypothetical protein FE634_12310 [Nocardioides sp. S-1144]